MPGTVTTADRVLLAKLCGLLGSDHAGERENAIRLVLRFLRERGLTWFDIIVQPEAPTVRPPAPGPRTHCTRAGLDWRRAAADAAHHPELLTQWERDFLAGIQKLKALTAKQLGSLERIVLKVQAALRQGAGEP